MPKISENNGTEEIGLVTPTPEYLLRHSVETKLQMKHGQKNMLWKSEPKYQHGSLFINTVEIVLRHD